MNLSIGNLPEINLSDALVFGGKYSKIHRGSRFTYEKHLLQIFFFERHCCAHCGRGGVARAEWTPISNQPPSSPIEVRQAEAYTSPEYTPADPDEDSAPGSGSFTTIFHWNPVGGATAPANGNFTINPSVASDLNVSWTFTNGGGPSGGNAILGINGSLRQRAANVVQNGVEYDQLPNLSDFNFTQNFPATLDNTQNPNAIKVTATFNLSVNNQSNVQSSATWVPNNPNTPWTGGKVMNNFVATVLSGSSTVHRGTITPSP